MMFVSKKQNMLVSPTSASQKVRVLFAQQQSASKPNLKPVGLGQMHQRNNTSRGMKASIKSSTGVRTHARHTEGNLNQMI